LTETLSTSTLLDQAFSKSIGRSQVFHRANATSQQELTVLVYTIGHWVAMGSQQGRKVFTLQTIPAWEGDDRFARRRKWPGLACMPVLLQRPGNDKKLERLCRYLSRPAVCEKRLSLSASWNISNRLKNALQRWEHARHLRTTGLHR